MRKKIFFSALIFFSCASKNPLNPENIIDIKIPLEWELSVSESINFSENWWNNFDDDNLSLYMNEFMDENINLEKAMLNTRKAKQASVIATGSLLPSISISSGVVESEQNTAGIPTIFSTLLGQSSDEVTIFTQEN